MTIEEICKRADIYVSNKPLVNADGIELKRGFIDGALWMRHEQRKFDIDNACEALYGLMYDLGCDLLDIDKAKEYVRNKMEGMP